MGVDRRGANQRVHETCACCTTADGGSAVVTDVVPLSAEQRVAFVCAWRRICGGSAAPPSVLRAIFTAASTTRTRIVRCRALPSVASLTLCGEADF